MDVLTAILLGIAFLAAAVFVGRAVFARRQLPPTPTVPVMPPPAHAKRRPPPSRELPTAPGPSNSEGADVARLRLKLINCFGGNEGAMTRSVKFEWGKRPHLSEKELLEKMLYDFERRR